MSTHVENAADAHLLSRPGDKYAVVDGLRMRYVERGEGPAVLFMHGASLGSSADVFLRNLEPLARAGLRAIAFDLPGYGLSDVGDDQSYAYQLNSVPKFMDALGLKKAAFVAHSRSGSMAVQLALGEPGRYSHLVVLGNGSLLPPLGGDVEGRYDAVARRVDSQMAMTEPTLEETRKLLEADVYNHDLITAGELALRHSRSVGKAFATFVARSAGAEGGSGNGGQSAKPIWQRLTELKLPLLMIYGRNDRAHAFERARLLKETYPQINLHIVDNCKHMVPWDAAHEVVRLAIPFLKT